VTPVDATYGSAVNDDSAGIEIDLHDLLDRDPERAATEQSSRNEQEVRPVGPRPVLEVGDDAKPTAGIMGCAADAVREPIVAILEHHSPSFRRQISGGGPNDL